MLVCELFLLSNQGHQEGPLISRQCVRMLADRVEFPRETSVA